MRTIRAAVVALALAGAVAACGSDQDPGITPQDTSGGPATTSHLLSSCPTDGAAPTVDCLDEDGKVVHP
jgi:hypothetical protein